MTMDLWAIQQPLRRALHGGRWGMLALAACGGSDGGEQGKPLDLTILHINDHHSTLESRSKTLELSAGGMRLAIPS